MTMISILTLRPTKIVRPLVERREKQSIGCCDFMSKVFNEWDGVLSVLADGDGFLSPVGLIPRHVICFVRFSLYWTSALGIRGLDRSSHANFDSPMNSMTYRSIGSF